MLIYHYTDLRGLQGIVKSRELYATNILYLNDSREFVYLYELLLNEVLPGVFEPGSAEHDRLAELLADQARFERARGVFVACFCGAEDLLSQWRGYGASAGQGVALGFDRAILTKAMDDHYSLPRKDPDDPLSMPDIFSDHATCKLEQCVYDPDQQQEPLRRALGALDVLGTEDVHLQLTAISCGLDAARVKHPSFREEDEWRLIYECRADTFPIEYRVGKTMLIPFVRVDLSPVFQDALKTIVVGPTSSQELSASSIRGFLEAQDLAQTRVIPSRVPFRNT